MSRAGGSVERRRVAACRRDRWTGLNCAARALASDVGAGDTLLFDATALHGIEAIHSRPMSYLSVVLTLRE